MRRLLLDENFNQRILRGLKLRLPNLDYVVAQETGPRGRKDPLLLAQSAELNRILLTHDAKTIPRFAYERVTRREPMPGSHCSPANTQRVGAAVEELFIVIECSNQSEYENRVLRLPL